MSSGEIAEEIKDLQTELQKLPQKIKQAQADLAAAQSEPAKIKGQRVLAELERRKTAIPLAVADLQKEEKLAAKRATFKRQ